MNATEFERLLRLRRMRNADAWRAMVVRSLKERQLNNLWRRCGHGFYVMPDVLPR